MLLQHLPSLSVLAVPLMAQPLDPSNQNDAVQPKGVLQMPLVPIHSQSTESKARKARGILEANLNNEETHPAISLDIGTPPQRVSFAFDTGSADPLALAMPEDPDSLPFVLGYVEGNEGYYFSKENSKTAVGGQGSGSIHYNYGQKVSYQAKRRLPEFCVKCGTKARGMCSSAGCSFQLCLFKMNPTNEPDHF
jgi:hypothetical protein